MRPGDISSGTSVLGALPSYASRFSQLRQPLGRLFANSSIQRCGRPDGSRRGMSGHGCERASADTCALSPALYPGPRGPARARRCAADDDLLRPVSVSQGRTARRPARQCAVVPRSALRVGCRHPAGRDPSLRDLDPAVCHRHGRLPGVVLNDGTKLIFARSTLIRATPILMATLRSADAPTIGARTIIEHQRSDTVAMKPPWVSRTPSGPRLSPVKLSPQSPAVRDARDRRKRQQRPGSTTDAYRQGSPTHSDCRCTRNRPPRCPRSRTSQRLHRRSSTS